MLTAGSWALGGCALRRVPEFVFECTTFERIPLLSDRLYAPDVYYRRQTKLTPAGYATPSADEMEKHRAELMEHVHTYLNQQPSRSTDRREQLQLLTLEEGMNQEHAALLLGRPDSTRRGKLDYGSDEVWVYKNAWNDTILFDYRLYFKDGRLVEIEQLRSRWRYR
jgi:hypothetical protein